MFKSIISTVLALTISTPALAEVLNPISPQPAQSVAPVTTTVQNNQVWRNLTWGQSKSDVTLSLQSQGLILISQDKKAQDYYTTIKIDDVDTVETKFEVRLAFAEDNIEYQKVYKTGLVAIVFKSERPTSEKRFKQLVRALQQKYGQPVSIQAEFKYGFFGNVIAVPDAAFQTNSTNVVVKVDVPKLGVPKLHMLYTPNSIRDDI